MQTTRSQVASIEVQANAAITSHTASDQYESRGVVPDDATTLDMHGGSNEEEPEDEIPEEAVMDDRRPDIFLSDLPHSDVLPTEYLWRQCAVFMEVKKCLPGTVPSAMAPQQWPLNSRLLEDTRVVIPRTQVYKSVITQMAGNTRILMATRPSSASASISRSVAQTSIWRHSIEMARLFQGLTSSRRTLDFTPSSLLRNEHL